MSEIKIELISALTLSIAFITWLVRLEGRVNYNEKANEQTQKDIDSLRIKHEALVNI